MRPAAGAVVPPLLSRGLAATLARDVVPHGVVRVVRALQAVAVGR